MHTHTCIHIAYIHIAYIHHIAYVYMLAAAKGPTRAYAYVYIHTYITDIADLTRLDQNLTSLDI